MCIGCCIAVFDQTPHETHRSRSVHGSETIDANADRKDTKRDESMRARHRAQSVCTADGCGFLHIW